MSIIRLRQLERGDTIIEVMIVLAILGMAIGISFATANRSLLATRGAQENSLATELLQGQIELLRASANITDTTSPNYIYHIGLFCLDASGARVEGFTGTILTQIDTPNIYPAGCVIDNNYHISITYGGAGDDKFTVKAIWDDVQGSSTDSATLVYRVHSQ